MPALNKEFFDIQATIECGFTLKRVRDMIKTYYHMHRTDKYSQHSSSFGQFGQIVVFVYELSDCGFESSCSHCADYYHKRAQLLMGQLKENKGSLAITIIMRYQEKGLFY